MFFPPHFALRFYFPFQRCKFLRFNPNYSPPFQFETNPERFLSEIDLASMCEVHRDLGDTFCCMWETERKKEFEKYKKKKVEDLAFGFATPHSNQTIATIWFFQPPPFLKFTALATYQWCGDMLLSRLLVVCAWLAEDSPPLCCPTLGALAAILSNNVEREK